MRLTLIVLLTAWGLLQAQTNANKGNIGGWVSNGDHQPIAHARVTIVNRDTGFERQVLTNDAGLYEFGTLESGAYEVRAEASDASASIGNLAVTVGGTLRVNIELRRAGNAQTVDLSTSALSVAESSPSDVLAQDVIESLPIDGRRFQDFATLYPAVLALPETLGQLSFAGQRGIYSNIMLDGADYNEPMLGGIRGGERSTYAFTVPQSAIQEFQVIAAAPPVDYGRTSGGMLNASTRSGSNTLHGEAFYQIRDQSLGVADPLGLQSLDRQQQFGGAVGGHLVKDKLFFFAAAERQTSSYPRSISFPGLSAVAGQITPDIAPAYNYLTSLEGPFTQTNDDTAVFARADYQFGAGSRLTLRYNHSGNTALNAVSLGASLDDQVNQALSSNGAERDHTQTGGGEWATVFSASTVNDFRMQYTGEDTANLPNSIGPSVIAGTIGSFGTSTTLPYKLSDYRIQASDSVSVNKGRHSASFGFDYSYIGGSQWAGSNQYGSFIINNDSVADTLRILSGTAGNNRFDDPSVVYLRQVGGLTFNANVHQAAFYVQDNWRILPGFTISYGLRWEAQINPQPLATNAFLANNILNYPFPRGLLYPTRIRDPLDEFAPRAGFAWDLFGQQNTVIRGNAAISYAQSPLALLAGPLTDVSAAPADLSLEISPAAGSTIYRQFLAGGFNFNQYALNSLPVFTVPDVWVNVAGKPNPYAQANVITTTADKFTNPRATQIALSIEHQISHGLIVAYDLYHINSDHLLRSVTWNVPEPFVRPGDLSLRPFFGLRSGTPPPNPNLGLLTVLDSSARANYTGHSLRIHYRTAKLLAGASYTLSYNKSDGDEEGNDPTAITYPNPFDFSREYNWSSIDARHQASGYAVWHGPLGIDVSGLFHVRSGLPIDASTGADSSELLSNNGSRPLSAPGVFMLRNDFRNRSYKSVDLRIGKRVALRERATLEVYGDLFNAFNFNNVAFISAAVYPNNPAFIYGPGVLSNGSPAPVAPGFLQLRTANGQYNSGTTAQQGTPFQAQLGLRVMF